MMGGMENLEAIGARVIFWLWRMNLERSCQLSNCEPPYDE
jgi:hypothetical protein